MPFSQQKSPSSVFDEGLLGRVNFKSTHGDMPSRKHRDPIVQIQAQQQAHAMHLKKLVDLFERISLLISLSRYEYLTILSSFLMGEIWTG
jgi:hypothetical protein